MDTISKDTQTNTLERQRPGPAELFRTMGTLNIHREACERGLNLSAFLEQQDPSERYKDGLDAFGRQLKAAGIRVNSNPAQGYYADRWEAFNRDENSRALVHEWAARQWRKVTLGDPNTRALLTSDAEGLNTSLRPYADAAAIRRNQITPSIPISELVALTTPIEGDAYRAAYLVDAPADQARLVRIAEGTEIPRVTITTSEKTVRLKKYGRGIEATYEQMRRQRIDKIAFWLAQLAVQAEKDKLATIMDVIINGDGNAGTAATVHNLTTLDPAAVAGTLTLKGWLAFKLKFPNPYALVLALMQEAMSLQLMLLNLGSANVPLVTIQAQAGFGSLTPISPELRDNVRFGITTEAPANRIVGSDTRFSIERITEIGSTIQETERYVSRQTEALFLTETEGYMKLDVNSDRVLNVAA